MQNVRRRSRKRCLPNPPHNDTCLYTFPLVWEFAYANKQFLCSICHGCSLPMKRTLLQGCYWGFQDRIVSTSRATFFHNLSLINRREWGLFYLGPCKGQVSSLTEKTSLSSWRCFFSFLISLCFDKPTHTQKKMTLALSNTSSSNPSLPTAEIRKNRRLCYLNINPVFDRKVNWYNYFSVEGMVVYTSVKASEKD